MTNPTECDDIQFLMSPHGRNVTVVWGVPRRPRNLSLFVERDPAISSYMWGTTCAHSYELARSILTFALNHVETCDQCGVADNQLTGTAEPTEEQVLKYVNEVVSLHAIDSTWEVTLAEVREWLDL